MGRTVGFTFSVGARLQSSVASAFDTVAGRASRLKRDMKDLRAVSGTAGKLTSAKATVDSLRAEAAAGKDVSKQLAAAERAYASASRSAAKYNINVGNAAAVHAKATAQMQRSEAALRRQETIMRNRSKRDELKGEIMGTVASVAVVAAPVKMAVEFESAMADAAKTIDGMRDEAGRLTPEYYKMEAAVKRMGRELPLTHDELAKLFAAGGQLGLSSTEELEEFTTMSAHMAVAFGMSTEEAADAIGGYRTALKLTMPEVREVLDLMNQFANTGSASEKGIADIVRRIGPLGNVGGVAAKPMTALAATLDAMKVSPEVAATGIKNLILAMTAGTAATKAQRESYKKLGIDTVKLAKQMQTDGPAAIISVLEAVKKLPKAQQLSIMQEIFGKESLGSIAPLLDNLDLVKQNLITAGDTTAYAGAMQQEFANRAKTTANALILAKNRVSELGISLGSVLLPAVVAGAQALGRFLEPVIGYAQANPTVVSGAFALVGGLVAIRVAALAGGFGLTALSNAALVGRVALTPLIWITNALTTATFRQSVATRAAAVWQRVLNVAMKANPVGIIITAVTALVGWFVYLYEQTGSVGGALSAMWDGCVSGLKLLTKPLEWALSGIGKIVSWLGSDDADKADSKIEEGLARTGEDPETPAPPKPQAAQMRPVAAAPPSVSGPPSMPSPGDFDAAQAEAAAARHVGIQAATSGQLGGPVSISPTFAFNISMDGVPDREFGRRVLDSLESEKSSIQRLLSGLLADAARVQYG